MVAGGGGCFAFGVKRNLEQPGEPEAHVDPSALYPSDPGPDLPHKKPSATERNDCDGRHCEDKAVREALAGWRWL